MRDRRLDELRLSGNLPSPTGVGLEILRLTQGDGFGIAELARTISADPALSGRILKLANSAAGAGRDPVVTVEAAAMRLGVRAVRSVSLGFTLVGGSRIETCPGFDYDEFWSHSLAAGVAAQHLAEHFGWRTPEEAFTCALVADIGRLALASIHGPAYGEVLAASVSANPGVEEVVRTERSSLGIDHCDLTGALLEDWRMPEAFVFAASNYEYGRPPGRPPSQEAETLTRVLRAAARMARACAAPERMTSSQWVERWEELTALRSELILGDEGFADLCARVTTGWREWGELLEVPTHASPGYDEIARNARRAQEAAVARGGSTDESADESEGEGGKRRGLRVLAVDDDPVSLRLLTHHLERDGHIVTRASNGREALQKALQEKPQMVVTDWMMPELDGLGLVIALRASSEWRGTYVLIVTGREDEERVVQAFDAGADEYVTKPFNPRILLARVRAGQRIIELREQVESDHLKLSRQAARMAVLNRRLRSAAMTDVLTELPNRRYAMQRLEEELGVAGRDGSPISLISLDIDHFKRVNDTYGHDVGDVVLRGVALVLQRATRKGEVVCRFGGEEFVVLCVHSDLATATHTAERLRVAVGAHVFESHPEVGKMTISLGVATRGPGADTVDSLLKAADRCVYAAKDAGRNRTVSADDSEPLARPA